MYSISSNLGSITKQIQSYITLLEPHIEKSGSMETIGHRLGDHFSYPKTVNEDKKLSNYKSVSDMMDTSFTALNLTGIELDVRLWNDKVVCIVHDKIKNILSTESEHYLTQNTLDKVLAHFIEKGYYKTCSLYIEVKLSGKFFHKTGLFPDVITEHEKKLIQSLILSIEAMIANHPDKDTIRRSIAILSFSLSALHFFYKESAATYRLYLIISTDQFMKKNLSRVLFYFPLTENQKVKIQFSEWLTGLWFDPSYIQNPGNTLNDINAMRKKPLELYLSSYGMKPEKLINKLQKGKKLCIHGVIFECEP
jgi:glycerophosphoryl diester phosphodiesterase